MHRKHDLSNSDNLKMVPQSPNSLYISKTCTKMALGMVPQMVPQKKIPLYFNMLQSQFVAPFVAPFKMVPQTTVRMALGMALEVQLAGDARQT